MLSRLVVVGLSFFALPLWAFSQETTLPVDLGGGVSITLIRVPAGTFDQGSPETEKGRKEDEKPRKVTISKDFWIGQSPVTRGQFARFVQETGYKTEAEKGSSGGFGAVDGRLIQNKQYNWKNPGFEQSDDHPVVCVTYEDSLAFCKWLEKKAKRSCTLPTEAQWEYAARAKTQTPYFQGANEENLKEIGWYKANSIQGTKPVGQKKANAWGLVDVSGNVFEWCQDWYGPYEDGPVTDPLLANASEKDTPRKVLRGGSFLREAKDCRCAARYRNTPGSRNADNGFRVVCSIDEMRSALPMRSAWLFAEIPPIFANLAQIIIVIVGLFGIFFFVMIILAFFHARKRVSTLEEDPNRLSQFSAGRLVPPTPDIRPTVPGLQVQLAADGFWLEWPPTLSTGAIIRYRYWINKTSTDGETSTTLGTTRRFIYTGTPPIRVEILNVATAAYEETTYTPSFTPSVPQPRNQTPPPRPKDDGSSGADFDGYPSAY